MEDEEIKKADGEGDDAGQDDTGNQDDAGGEGQGQDGTGQGAGDDGPTEVETLAADMGWAPEDKWRGDAEKWVDAKTFIKQGPEILKSSLRTQDALLESNATKLTTLNETVEGMARASKDVEERAYKRAVADLEAKRREAVAEGDTDAYDAASKEMDALDKPEPAKEADKGNGADKAPDDAPGFKAFTEANSWYNEDVEMTAYAEQIAPVVGRKAQGEEFYRQIGAEVKKKFPDRFGNQARREARPVEGAGSNASGRGKSGKKGYADLPKEAKGVCDELVAEGVSTKESYCASYFEEDAV